MVRRRGRYYEEVSDDVDDARDYLAHRTDQLAARRADLAERAVRLRARQPTTDNDLVAAERAATDGLAHAVAAHRRAAAQHERTAMAHERCADILDGRGRSDRSADLRQAAAVEREAAERSRAEADRAEREGTPLAPEPR